MSDKIINVNEWIRENIDREVQRKITSEHELECLAYFSMLQYKLYLMGQGSDPFSKSFRKMMRQGLKKKLCDDLLL